LIFCVSVSTLILARIHQQKWLSFVQDQFSKSRPPRLSEQARDGGQAIEKGGENYFPLHYKERVLDLCGRG